MLADAEIFTSSASRRMADISLGPEFRALCHLTCGPAAPYLTARTEARVGRRRPLERLRCVAGQWRWRADQKFSHPKCGGRSLLNHGI